MPDRIQTTRTVMIAGTLLVIAAPAMAQEGNLRSSRHYDTDDVENPPRTHAALADPQHEDMVCSRSGDNFSSQTILAALIGREDAATAGDRAQGVAANFARRPEGGGGDQSRALGSGECAVAMVNT